MSINVILRGKAAGVVSLEPNESISAACRLFAARGVGAALVLDGGGALLGVLSERDVVRAVARHGASTLEMTAGELMRSAVHTVTPETTVTDAMETMTVNRVRHLPVLVENRPVGVVSIGDVVKHRLDQQAEEFDRLRDYVSGQG